MKRFLSLSLVGLAGAGVLSLGLLTARLVPFGAERGWPNPLETSTTARISGPVVLQQIQQLQRLETCRYTGQVIVRGDTKGLLPAWAIGDQILFVGQGEVVAGIDLARIGDDDLQVEGDRVSLRLPPVEILYSRLDNHRSEVFERRVGFLSRPDPDLESRVRIEAEDQIRGAAVQRGVLSSAEENARAALRAQLESLGFREISFL